ncbi:MAG: hypothetical protein LQ345_001965 [Seirophora villosa]|nr:MAG: hypothetical protein LQ345_001965 [Seirophora villosa]
MLPDYSYSLQNIDSEPLNSPQTGSTWQDFTSTSDPYHLPPGLRNRYDFPHEDYSRPYESLTTGREAGLAGSPWAEARLYETSASTFMSTSAGACEQFEAIQGFGDGGSPWNVSNFPSHFSDYPTPRSNLSLSPPQHAQGKGSSVLLRRHAEGDGRYAARSDTAASAPTLEEVPAFGTSYPRQLRASSPGEVDSLYQRGDDPRPLNECDEADDGGGTTEEPYAQLIFRALKNAPGHSMVLKDIYRWFERNTDKASKSSKGWQNSIRHNLSMNGAFKKVEQDAPTDEAKRGFIWVLEPTALVEGVKSTTRYRKPGSNKKNAKARYPAPERQRSGAKGGKAPRKAANIRRCARSDGTGSHGGEDVPLPSVEVGPSNMGSQPLTPSSMRFGDHGELMFGTASRSLSPIKAESSTYDYGDIEGVTSVIPDGPLFAADGHNAFVDDSFHFHQFSGDHLTAGGASHGLPDF